MCLVAGVVAWQRVVLPSSHSVNQLLRAVTLGGLLADGPRGLAGACADHDWGVCLRH